MTLTRGHEFTLVPPSQRQHPADVVRGADIMSENTKQKLERLTPAQTRLAERVLRYMRRSSNPAPDAPVYERYAVARAKATAPQPSAPAGVGVMVREFGSAQTLDKLRVKGYLDVLVLDDGWSSSQRFYSATEAGLEWYEKRMKAAQAAAVDMPQPEPQPTPEQWARNPIAMHPDDIVREVNEAIQVAFVRSNQLKHGLAAQRVQVGLAAARRALDTYATFSNEPSDDELAGISTTLNTLNAAQAVEVWENADRFGERVHNELAAQRRIR